MNESRETSYYEIALTSRQAFTAFVLLLICVVTSFFAGLWVGSGAEAGDAFAEARIQTARTNEGESQLQELKFFSEDEEPGKEVADPEPVVQKAKESEKGSAVAPAKPTLLEQLAGEGGTSRPGNRQRQAAKRRPRPAAEAQKQAAKESEPTATKPAQPVAQPAVAKKQAPAPSLDVPSGEEIIIQVFSSADRGQASRVLDRLKADGYGAYVEPIEEKGQTLYRVRVGPYASKEAAEPAAAEVRRKHRLDTWITRAGG